MRGIRVRVSQGMIVRVRVMVTGSVMVRVGVRVRVRGMHALACPRQWSVSSGTGTLLR